MVSKIAQLVFFSIEYKLWALIIYVYSIKQKLSVYHTTNICISGINSRGVGAIASSASVCTTSSDMILWMTDLLLSYHHNSTLPWEVIAQTMVAQNLVESRMFKTRVLFGRPSYIIDGYGLGWFTGYYRGRLYRQQCAAVIIVIINLIKQWFIDWLINYINYQFNVDFFCLHALQRLYALGNYVCDIRWSSQKVFLSP